MRLLVDRCTGAQVAAWLRRQGHDVVFAAELEDTAQDDRALLRMAVETRRVLVTIDTDFGQLVFEKGLPHAGLIRLPDRRVRERLALLLLILDTHGAALEAGAVVTVKGERIRVSGRPNETQ